LETRNVIINFMSAEKIKSELIIASKLIVEMETIEEKEIVGAKKLLLSFLDALKMEVHFAKNISNSRSFDEVDAKMEEAKQNVNSQKFSEALKNVSAAISFATTLGQQAAQELAERNFL